MAAQTMKNMGEFQRDISAASDYNALGQFLEIAEGEGLDVSERPFRADDVRKCVLAGFSDHLARRIDAGTLRAGRAHQEGVALQLMAQFSSVTRTPFSVPTGTPANASAKLFYVNVRFVLP